MRKYPRLELGSGRWSGFLIQNTSFKSGAVEKSDVFNKYEHARKGHSHGEWTRSTSSNFKFEVGILDTA